MEIVRLCLGIFLARICDVSLGTIRTFRTVKGRSVYAACIGFLEVIIWFLVVRNALSSDSSSIWIAVSYAGGYATGTYIGSKLAKLLLHEKLDIRLTVTKEQLKLVDILRKKGFAVSTTVAKGYKYKTKYLVFMEIDDKELEVVEKIVKEFDDTIYMVISETMFVHNGYFKDVIK